MTNYATPEKQVQSAVYAFNRDIRPAFGVGTQFGAPLVYSHFQLAATLPNLTLAAFIGRTHFQLAATLPNVSLVAILHATPGVVVPAPAENVGEDIFLDIVADEDRPMTISGDWRLVAGDEALKQSLIRRLVTPPGEWRTLPGFGVGVGLYLGSPMTRAVRDELANRIRDQFLRDDRVVRVLAVDVELQADYRTLTVTVKYQPRSQPLEQRPETLVVRIT